MKRLIAVIGMILMIILSYQSWDDFNHANTGIALFKSILLIVIAIFAFLGFLEDFKENKWPL